MLLLLPLVVVLLLVSLVVANGRLVPATFPLSTSLPLTLLTLTLSLFAGANDVPMIKAAHVGVGIAGVEGQATSPIHALLVLRARQHLDPPWWNSS